MTEKQKAHPTAATVEQAGREFAGSTFPCYDFSTAAPACQAGRVSACLGVGQENAVPGHDLVRLLGLRGLRDLTQIVERGATGGSANLRRRQWVKSGVLPCRRPARAGALCQVA